LTNQSLPGNEPTTLKKIYETQHLQS